MIDPVPCNDFWPGERLQPALSLEDCALVVIDMQRGYADPDNVRGRWMRDNHPMAHSYYFRRMKQATARLRRILDLFRANGLAVIHVVFGPERADMTDMRLLAHRDGPPWARFAQDFEPFRLGGEQHAIVAELTPVAGEPVFNKTSHSAFTSTPIESHLESHGLRRLVIGGWATNACVELTGRDAADRGFDTFLVEDACAAFTPATHNAALLNFVRLYGGVVTADHVLENG